MKKHLAGTFLSVTACVGFCLVVIAFGVLLFPKTNQELPNEQTAALPPTPEELIAAARRITLDDGTGYYSYDVMEEFLVARQSINSNRGDSEPFGFVTRYWIFDRSGKLILQQTFPYYTTLALVTTNNVGIFTNVNYGEGCETGCGVFCTQDFKDNQCEETMFWAFDLNTGNLLWFDRINDLPANDYGRSDIEITEEADGTIMMRFSVGYIHKYKYTAKIDLHTGEIGDYEVKVRLNDPFDLVTAEETLRFSSHEVYFDAESLHWRLPSSSELFIVLNKHPDGRNISALTLDELLVIKESERNTYQTDVPKIAHIFDKLNGKLLWTFTVDEGFQMGGHYSSGIIGNSEIVVINICEDQDFQNHGSKACSLVGFDRNSGEKKWIYAPPEKRLALKELTKENELKIFQDSINSDEWEYLFIDLRDGTIISSDEGKD